MEKNIWTILALFCLVAAALTQGTWWRGAPTIPAPFYGRIHAGWLGLAILLGYVIFK